MGLMAVGAVCFVEPLTDPDEEDTLAPEDTQATDDISPPLDQSTSAATLTADETDTDGGTFDPDYDSRGGDDGALLEPVVIDDADTVELVEGSNSDDQIDGAEGNDRIQGLDGDDNLNGGAGDDELRGDSGEDALDGGAGNDTLLGEDGADIMRGGDANDTLFGQNADDLLFGEDGNDSLQASAGNDELDGGAGNDTLSGGLDDDTLTGGAGADLLFGGWGNDVLSGLMRNAVGVDEDDSGFLNGGGGDDSILVGAGDIVSAGDGADEIVLGDWLGAGEAAEILDYSAEDDSLVLVWDDGSANSEEPSITLSLDTDEYDAAQTIFMLDGAVVAMVNGTALTVADIALIPLSTATQVGLASA